MDILKLIFHWVLFSSVNAGIVALLIIAIRTALKSRIAPRVLCLLWLLVVVKLITAPIVEQSQIGVFHLFHYQQVSSDASDAGYSGLKNIEANKPLNSTIDIPDQPGRESGDTYHARKLASNTRNESNPGPISVLALVWVAGLLLVICVFACSGIAFAQRLRNAEKIPDALLPELIRNYRQKKRGGIDFYTSSSIMTPCISGVIKPKIYMPQQIFEQSDKQQLTHILMHELAHVIRKDNLLNVLVAALNTLHWFNPILWYAMKLFNLDREASCDACALEIIGQDETIPYGLTLLQNSKTIPQNHFQFRVSSYFKSEKQIERRIRMIKNFKKGSYKFTATALVLCIFFGLATIANAAGISEQTGSAAGTGQPADSGDDMIRAALGNNSYMYFNSLERASKFASFNFKVPDYLPLGFELYNMALSKEKNNNNGLMEIHYWSTTDGGKMVSDQEEHHFSLTVSNVDLQQMIKSVKDVAYDESLLNISGLKVLSITVHHSKQKSSDPNTNILDTIKHLVWKDSNVWYDLEYYVSSTEQDGTPYVMDNLSLDECTKIITSMKDPQDIRNVDYTSKLFSSSFAIYDRDDLKDADNLLGFIPKFPLCIADGFNISSARISSSTYFESDQITPMLTTKYNADSKDDTEKTIQIQQSHLSSLYDSIMKSGCTSYRNTNTNKNEIVKSKTVSIAGVGVFTFDITFANEKMFVWEQDGVYYNASFPNGIDNMEAILKTFITLNP